MTGERKSSRDTQDRLAFVPATVPAQWNNLPKTSDTPIRAPAIYDEVVINTSPGGTETGTTGTECRKSMSRWHRGRRDKRGVYISTIYTPCPVSQPHVTEMSDLFGPIPAPKRAASKATRQRMAQVRLDRAMSEIPHAVGAIARAREAQAPYEAAFWSAHQALAEAWEACHVHNVLTKEALFRAYDRRMEAGYAWHPSREKLRAAQDWLKAVQKEADEASQELGG